MWNEGHPESRVARRFVEAINARDPDRIAALMAEAHEFVDATGKTHKGRETMRTGWRQYLAAFPGYLIEVEDSLGAGETVALFGWASGSFGGPGGPGFRIPAAWKATIRGGEVLRWVVYCDVEPMLRTMGQPRP
jgi:ketosteroid isomerase-like protein